MAELKPCCGLKPFISEENFGDIGHKWWVWCSSCEEETALYDTKQQAIDAWNKRSK